MQLVKTFPAATATPISVNELVTALVHYRHEVDAMLVCASLVGKSTASAFVLADPDHDIIFLALLAAVRASLMSGLKDNVNLPYDRLRDIGVYALGYDAAQLYPECRVGAAVPVSSGSAKTYRLCVAIPFMNIQKEFPNMHSYSAGQLKKNCRIDLDLTPAARAIAGNTSTNIVLTNGTFAATGLSFDLRLQLGDIRDRLWCAPPTKFFERQTTNGNIDQENGPLFDEAAFTVHDSPNFAAGVNDNLEYLLDGKQRIKQTPLAEVSASYSAYTKTNLLGAPGYDVASNNKHAGIGGRVALVSIPGARNPVEGEYPAAGSGRSFNFGSKFTGPENLFFWRQFPFNSTEMRDHVSAMQNDSDLQSEFAENLKGNQAAIDAIKALSIDEMAIYGGGSGGPGAKNSTLGRFKARIFARAAGVGK